MVFANAGSNVDLLLIWFQWNMNKKYNIFIGETKLENVVCTMATI